MEKAPIRYVSVWMVAGPPDWTPKILAPSHLGVRHATSLHGGRVQTEEELGMYYKL
jgi:hypothetical protein